MTLRNALAVVPALLPLGCLITVSTAFSRPTPVPPAPKTVKPVSYHEEIEPFFKANCTTCHGDEDKSGLKLDSVDAIRKGGMQHGAKIIVPGNAKASLLIAYLRGQNQTRMPMNRPPVPESTIRRIETWINQGAKIDALKVKFPYAPPAPVAVPVVKNKTWGRNPIDNFVLTKLEAKGMHPAPPASKVALLRRVYADLVGVPPTPEEADRFFADTSPNAYAKLVDRLLADPRYGERWARHWLDLVRYAETNGFESDNIRPHAWRYRDYVIRSFNADKPYNLFLKEQIAGDELYPGNPDALIATGFARLGPWDELSSDHKQRWQDYLNDVTDTTGSAMLGMTVGCARCHDHKYDRITQADYYRFQAFFAATKWVDTKLPASVDSASLEGKYRELQINRNALSDRLSERIHIYRSVIAGEREKTLAPGAKAAEVTDEDIQKYLDRDDKKQQREERDALNQQIEALESQMNPISPVAETITDTGAKDVAAQHILLRGNLTTPGPEVQPGFIASLCSDGVARPAAVPTPAPDAKTTGRRTQLANWIASEKNPLTARVMVNRLFQFHFGRGIVGTTSDFGVNGEQPTHPELLDYLALRFIKEGWSLKKMHRLMVLSATYQQATDTDALMAKRDPNNALMSRMNRIRLEGEGLRDSILSVSGRLNPERTGPSIYPAVSDEVLSTGSTHKWGNSPEDQQRRRTVYVFQRRSLPLPIVETFDGADMASSCPRRSTTTIAPQALALFNGTFGRDESRYFAERVVKEVGTDPGKQIERAYRIALCRKPTASQKTLAQDYLKRKAALYVTEKTDPTRAEQAALADFCHVLINTNEFTYLD